MLEAGTGNDVASCQRMSGWGGRQEAGPQRQQQQQQEEEIGEGDGERELLAVSCGFSMMHFPDDGVLPTNPRRAVIEVRNEGGGRSCAK